MSSAVLDFRKEPTDDVRRLHTVRRFSEFLEPSIWIYVWCLNTALVIFLTSGALGRVGLGPWSSDPLVLRVRNPSGLFFSFAAGREKWGGGFSK